ncbi:MAG TPA: PEP-CTERM sorting domain-containing protein [Planctomycetota bacterium]|nr:PEP-CTERM sorting domain-containing protein [Planctomycetota bacterium]
MCEKWYVAVLAVVMVGWVLVCGGRASADEIIAEFDVFSSSGSWSPSVLYDGAQWMAQTFTAAATGTAYSVDLALVSNVENNPDNLPLRVQLRTTYDSGANGILPTNTIIAQGSIAHDNSGIAGTSDWTNIPLSPADLSVGTMYAVVIKTDNMTDDAYRWYGKWVSGTDLYPGGRAVIKLEESGQYNFGGDLGFRVNGAIPEPATMVLLSLGGVGVLLCRRRRT